MHLSVFVSSKCFCQCLGCYSYSREEEPGSYLQDKYIIDFLTYAFKNGVNKVTLCGGDPLLRKNILDLIYKIKKIGWDRKKIREVKYEKENVWQSCLSLSLFGNGVRLHCL